MRVPQIYDIVANQMMRHETQPLSMPELNGVKMQRLEHQYRIEHQTHQHVPMLDLQYISREQKSSKKWQRPTPSDVTRTLIMRVVHSTTPIQCAMLPKQLLALGGWLIK